MATFGLGQGYNFYFGLAAAAPTTPSDETQSAYNKVGEIPGTITINRRRGVVDRRTRDDANARYVHMGDRTESVAFTMNLDAEDNAGYQDLQAAYNSDTDGVGSAGTLGYWIITDATASHLLWHGQGGVSDLSLTFPRTDGLVSANVVIECNTDTTETTHA